MSEWIPVTLGESCDILDNQRVPINSIGRAEIEGEIPYYGANGVQGYVNDFIFNEPLILIAEDGGYFDEYQTRPIAYRIHGKSWVNNHAHVLRAKPKYNQDFIFYSLQHKNITPFIKGGTRAKLNQAELKQVEFLCPEFQNEQAAIANVLEAVHVAIEKTEALIAKYQQIKAGLMHDLFTRGVTADGKLRPPREQVPELYHETPIGWIPKEWKVAGLDQACQHIVDCPHSTPNFVPSGVLVARTMHIKDGIFLEDIASRVSETEYRERVARLMPMAGDVIFTREAPVGEAFVIPHEMRICLGQRVMLIRPKASVLDGDYLVAQIYSGSLSLRISELTAGTTNPHLNVADVRNLAIAVPSFSEQTSMTKRIKAINAHIQQQRESLEKLRQQKLGLMHDLLTGKVRVKFADSQKELA